MAPLLHVADLQTHYVSFGGERVVPDCDLIEERALLAHVTQIGRAVCLDPRPEGRAEFNV